MSHELIPLPFFIEQPRNQEHQVKMNSINEIETMREALREDKVQLWSYLNQFFDKCFQVLDNDNRLAVYNEDYQPTFKVVHSVITKFANEMDECMEKKVELLKAQAEWTARMQAIKERQPINGEDSEDVGVGSHFDDDELSDSSYEPKIYRGSYTKLTHKGFYYRGSKSKITNPLMDLPDCKYKCQATGCSGTVQPMLKRNARIHIRSIEDHSCK